MSPLLGALGDSSEYAYRGNIDDVPNDFNFSNIVGAEPGIGYTSGPITITGLNNKILVSVSAGASIAINSGIFTSGPGFIRSGETIALYTPTTQGTDADFSKTYTVTATVGKTSKDWTVTTRDKDSTPNSFTFTNSVNQELGITSTSNTIVVSGIEPTVSSNASITLGIGSFSKNGGAPGTATTIGNGDTIAIVLQGPTDYSKTNTTAITVGDYTTTYSVSTRASDTTVNQFTFTDFVNVGLSSSYDSNSITLSGADNNTFDAPVPLTASVSGGFLKVVRGSTTVRDFDTAAATVYNGDILTLRLNSSSSYSTTTFAVLSVTGANTVTPVTDTFSVTTRPIVSDTIVDQFQFVDKSGQGRNISTISDPITISGITTHADDFAYIYLTNNNDGGQFRIRRNGAVVRDFSSSSGGVRNGDVVDLKITTSPASEGTVLTNVNIAGTDNSNINNIINQTRTDTWVVKSAKRNCPLVSPTLASVTGVDPSTLQSVTFIPTSYDNDCNVVVNTSNPNSYLNVNGTVGNNLVVLPGVACTVFMTAGTFSDVRTTTVTLTANNNVPTPVSTIATWSVTTRSINNPTVSISASPSTILCNESTTLTWSTSGAVNVTTDGFTGVTTSGSLVVGPLKGNKTYSITATGTDNTTKSSSVSVIVNTTAQVVLDADATEIDYNGSVTLEWATANASSVVSNFGVTATSGTITLNNLKETKTYTIRAVSNGGCADSPEDSVKVNVAPCAEDTESDTTWANGVSVNYTLANPGNGFAYYFSGLTGGSVNQPSREAESYSDSQFWSGYSTQGNCGGSAQTGPNYDYYYIPPGVNTVTIVAAGSGGGGGGGGGMYNGGRGGHGGLVSASYSVSPGDLFYWYFGGGGGGAGGCGGGNTQVGGCAGGHGYNTIVYNKNGNQIMGAAGGAGGGRTFEGGDGGGSYGFEIAGTGSASNGGADNGGEGGYSPGAPCVPYDWTYGQAGGPGYVEMYYTVNIEGASWSALINGINNQYKTTFKRPPTINEMDYWIGEYISYNIDSVAQVQSQISTSGAYKSSTGAVTYCGKTL